jgi:hypothetical protein
MKSVVSRQLVRSFSAAQVLLCRLRNPTADSKRNLSPNQSRSPSIALVNVLHRKAARPRDRVVAGRLHLAVYSGDTVAYG